MRSVKCVGHLSSGFTAKLALHNDSGLRLALGTRPAREPYPRLFGRSDPLPLKGGKRAHVKCDWFAVFDACITRPQADGSDVPAVGPGFDVQYNATTLVPISDLVAAVDRLVLACNTALKVPRPVYDFEEPANPLPNTQVPVDTCLEYISTALTLAERTARPSVSRLVGGPSTFYAVALHCSAEDPWSSHKTASKANGKRFLQCLPRPRQSLTWRHSSVGPLLARCRYR